MRSCPAEEMNAEYFGTKHHIRHAGGLACRDGLSQTAPRPIASPYPSGRQLEGPNGPAGSVTYLVVRFGCSNRRVMACRILRKHRLEGKLLLAVRWSSRICL
jgi:hypothetical protein